jgi:hypothetical protein
VHWAEHDRPQETWRGVLAGFTSKLAAYSCILIGVNLAIIPIFESLTGTIALNLSGVACAIAGIWWLVRLRRRFG